MYVPKHFEETRLDVLHGLIRAHPLAALITLAPGGLSANHIPIEIDPEPTPLGTLRGHVARANPVWREFRPDMEALVIFQGPSAYVSPAWYPTKKETGQVVPTWNYAVVHAHGPLRVIEDREWLRNLVEGLTVRYETGRADAWKITEAPAEYIDKMLGAIVGLEIPISRLTGKWKFSQNRPTADRMGTIAGLRREASPTNAAVAELMQRYQDR